MSAPIEKGRSDGIVNTLSTIFFTFLDHYLFALFFVAVLTVCAWFSNLVSWLGSM